MSVTPVSDNKQKALKERMQNLGILESEIEEKFIRGSGSGGQKINKTSSTVQLKHAPSGTEIKCQETRSLSLNRYYARVRLCDIIEQRLKGEDSKAARLANKIRKQKSKRNKRAKEKILHDKKIKSAVKLNRKRVEE